MATKRLWRWRGLSLQGIPCQGTLWQDNRPEALQALQRQGIIPLARRRCSVQSALWHPRYSGEIIRQLAALLQAGLPLAEGLELLAQQQPNAQWQALLQTLAEDLAQGISLSGSLEKWPEAFPPLYLAMIRTGELTGKLELCCAQLARQQREQLLLTEKVKKALRYPLIILSLALLVVMGMLCFVLPEFAAIYQNPAAVADPRGNKHWRRVNSLLATARCSGYFTCNTQPADLPAARLAAVPSEAAPYAAGVWQTAMRPAA